MTHDNFGHPLELYADDDLDPAFEKRIWCDFDLETIPAPSVWKSESLEWALTVNWELVNTHVREHFDELMPDLSGRELIATSHWRAFSRTDREGLTSLYSEPPYATPLQISSGGHRFEAMRRQGVRWALGQCHPSDVGAGVPELHAYLPA